MLFVLDILSAGFVGSFGHLMSLLDLDQICIVYMYHSIGILYYVTIYILYTNTNTVHLSFFLLVCILCFYVSICITIQV